MTKEQQKEQFSIAYVRAVAAAAGVNIYRPEVDADSLDIGFAVRSIVGRLRPPRLEAQLKCTTENGDGAVNLHFELKIKNYNELCGAHLVPRVLIVVVVPKRPQDWLSQDHESLTLHRCGYWLSLRDMPETANRKSVIVEIPRTQIFTVAALRQFLGAGGTI